MPNNYFDRKAFTTTIIAAVLLFFPLWLIVPSKYLGEILRAVAVAVAAGIVYAYAKGLISGYRHNRIDYGYMLVIGIVTAWFAIAMAVTVGWYNVATSDTPLPMTNVLSSFAIWLFILGGLLHLTAQDAISGHIPRSHWIRISTYIVFGTLTGLALLRFVLVP